MRLNSCFFYSDTLAFSFYFIDFFLKVTHVTVSYFYISIYVFFVKNLNCYHGFDNLAI